LRVTSRGLGDVYKRQRLLETKDASASTEAASAAIPPRFWSNRSARTMSTFTRAPITTPTSWIAFALGSCRFATLRSVIGLQRSVTWGTSLRDSVARFSGIPSRKRSSVTTKLRQCCLVLTDNRGTRPDRVRNRSCGDSEPLLAFAKVGELCEVFKGAAA
jgi:hypothetical protein